MMSIPLPSGACDSHCHVFGPVARFPFDPSRTYTPEDAPKEALFALHRRLGLERGVVVQPACHRFDHSALLDVLVSGCGAYRGVALLPEEATAETIAGLHSQGVRGARFNFMPHLSPPPSREGFRRIAAIIEPLHWHVVFHLRPAFINTALNYVEGFSLPFVIDHMARIDVREGVGQEAFQKLLHVTHDPRAWIKIAAADRASAGGAPYSDVEPFMRRIIDAAPDRVIWGTDWPHPNVSGATPDDDDLLALLRRVTNEEILGAILTNNPERLYGFGSINN